MKSKFTNFYIKISLYLAVFVGLSASSAYAQGFAGGKTYVVNGLLDQVAPIDTFVNLSGAGTAGAITYLNTVGIDVSQPLGTVTILLDQGYTGVEPTVVQVGATNGSGYPNMSGTRPVVLRPKAGLNFTIGTSANITGTGSLFRILGSTDFSIDGAGTPGERNITFQMGFSTSFSAKVIDIIPSAGSRIRNVSVRNCVIVGNTTPTTINTFAGIYFGGPNATPSNALLGTNYNISYNNNLIMGVQNGIYHRGFPTNISAFPSQDTGVNIINNIIGDYTNPINAANSAAIGGNAPTAANSSGIYLQTASNSTISGNVVRNTLRLVVANVNNGFAGIRLATDGNPNALDSNIRIVKNQIYNLFTNQISGGIAGIRVSLGTHGTSRRLLIANNSISNIASISGGTNIANVGTYTAGMLIDNNTTYVGLEILFNSVNLIGDTMAPSSGLAPVSACLLTGSGTTGGIRLLNNSFSNRLGGTVANTAGYSNYAVVVAANNINPFSYANFNNYYSNTFGSGYAFVAGIIRNGLVRNISTLKNYRLYSLSDSNSFGIIPPVTSDTVLTIESGFAHRTYNRGYALNTLTLYGKAISDSVVNKVVDDIFGNSRSGLGRFTSIGCHQWMGDSLNLPSALRTGVTYNIDGNSNPPKITTPNFAGSFKDLAEAVSYLNSYGIAAGTQNNVTLQINTGYPKETTWIPAMTDYPGSDPLYRVTIRPAVGVVDTIWAPNAANATNSSVFRLMGARNVTIDGLTSNDKDVRNLTFMFRNLSNNANSRVISITPSDTSCQNIVISNVNILGNTTNTAINTFAGIYYGFPFLSSVNPNQNDTLRSVANSNITITGNLIQGVRNGIHVRGSGANPAAAVPAFEPTAPGVITNRITNLLISKNTIGGTIAPGGTEPTTFIGGAASQAGIYVNGVENAVIDSNIIRNCLPTTSISNGFRGIDVNELPGVVSYPNFGVTVSKNFIYNLRTTNGQSCIGIRAQLAAASGARGYLFTNNHISNILSIGASAPISVNNPTGILIDATIANTATNVVTLVNNTINMSGNNILSSNSGITALYLGNNIRGGISSVNNIFGVTANRSTTGNMYAVTVLSATSPFAANAPLFIPASDFNSYFVSGNNPALANNILMATPSAAPATRTNINAIRTFMGTNIDLSSFSFPTRFISDTLPDLLAVTAGSRYTAGASVSIILSDIYGALKGAGSNLGAVNFLATNAALQPSAIYQINGVDNFPVLGSPSTGSFRTLRSAVNYLNAFGVGFSISGVNPVRLELSNGYVGETDTFITPITVLDYPFANIAVPVVVSVAPNRQDTIRFTNVLTPPALHSSLIRITSGRFFGFDGSNNKTSSRDLTIMMPSIMTSNTYKIIDLLGGQNSIFAVNLATSNNSVINCNLIGNSTASGINTFAAIYTGGITATPSNAIGTGLNNGNVFSNNFIGGCQYGIYLRGNGIRGQGDANNVISDNVIGGDIAPGGSVPTNYFGGINNAAGIFCVGQYTANISRNKIQNNIVTFTNPRGIELATIAGNNTVLDSANTIEGNIIKNISSTVASSSAYGIYMNFGADAGNITNSSVIKNNMISGIAAPGATTLMGGVYGIAIDGTANITDPNIGIYFNSVNLGTANTLATNTRSACLAIATPFRLDASSIVLNYGFKLTNNIFSNKLGGAPAATNVTARAVIIGNINSPFNFSDNNNFFTNASNANNGLLMGNAGATAPVTYTTWDSIYNFTGGDLFSSNLSAPFTSDLDLFIPASSNTVIKTVGVPVAGILTDAIGNTRNTFVPTIGAHEYSGGLYVDSVLPRILPANAVSCVSNLFNTVEFIVVDKNYTGNVFTYRVNGGTQINLPLSAAFIGTNFAGYRTITYTLPVSVLSAGGLIEYKITATDVAGNVGVYPSDKPWATLATGLSTFPYTMNFENGNADWSNQSLTLGANWNLGAFGSPSSPSQPTESGIRCALFPSSTLPAGASARLVSPCLNLSVLNRPILRFRFSQSNNLVTRRDSITVRMMVNGFLGSEVKVAVRPNVSSPFPDWFTYEVCLTEYRTPGNTYNVVFDAFSVGGGQNIMIDSIQILDDVQNQVIATQNATICNTSQPFSVTIPNSDGRYVYRALHLENGGGVSVLDTAFGNSGDLVLNFANRQVDTINYVISAINYGSGTYVAPFSVNPPNFCSNNLPGTFRTVINRFTRPLTNAGGYIIPDLTVGAFNGSANDGDEFKPDAVKFGNKLTYKILTPTSYYTTASYNTAWTLLNTTLKTVNGGTPATNFTFTPPTAGADAKVEFTPTAAEGDTLFVLSSTIRFLATNCDTVVTRYIKVNNPVAYNFVTGPRADTACTGTGLNFLINQGSLAGTTQLWNFDDGTISSFSTPSKTWATPGVYRVRLTVTSALGISDTVSRLIYVLQAPSANYTASSVAIVCQNDSTFFNVSNPAPGLTYLWNFPGNITRTAAGTTFGFSKADTNYAVSLRVTNPANACFAINNRIFPSYAKPKAKFTVTSHCQGLNMPYTDSSSISNGDRLGYFWTFSSGEARQSNTFQIKFVNSGNFRVSLRLTSAAGCEDTTSQIVTVYETPKADFIYNAACTNDSTTFTNQTVYGPGIQNADYIWDFGDNSGTDTRQDPKHRYLNNNSGDPFFVKLIASNKLFGCKDSTIKDLTVNTAPVAVAELGGTIKTGVSTDKVCVGNTVIFTSKSFSSNGAEVTCGWVFGNAQSSACNSFNVYPDPGVYNWSITATSNGCIDTKSGSITVVAKPVITYTKQHFAIPASRFTTNNRKVFTPSDLVTDKNTYSWNFGDVDSTTSNQRVAEFTYNKKGTYTVRMRVTTADGCVVTFTDTTIVDVGVSVGEELAAKFDLVAYPNPLTNNAFVSLNLVKSENISIVITDVLGREISTTNYDKVSAGKHNFELTSNNFTAAGAYFVKVKIGDETVVKSLVKQ